MKPIYPIELKPASGIRTWSGWPEDVVDRLREWNGGYRGLSFAGSGVFKCFDCDAFCAPQTSGALIAPKQADARKYGVQVCDDCLIARARRANEKAKTITYRGRMGAGSCICQATKVDVDGKTTFDWSIKPECTYHAAAAADPSNHSIPWNCRTYWDGCNCLLPIYNGPDA